MASLSSALSHGQVSEFLRILTESGMTPDMVEAVLRKQSLAGLMVEALKREFHTELVPGLFTSASDQLVHVRRLNQDHGWGFTEDDFAKLGPAPDAPTGKQDRLTAVVLEVVLASPTGQADILRTVDELWKLAAAEQEKSWRSEDLKSDPEHLALFEGVEAMPGLRWHIVDLAANWDKKQGIAPVSVRSPNSPHLAILMAAVLHPEWVRAMDGKTVPFVWIPGLKLNVPGSGEWCEVPYLYFHRDGRMVNFCTDWSGYRDPHYAVPVFRE